MRDAKVVTHGHPGPLDGDSHRDFSAAGDYAVVGKILRMNGVGSIVTGCLDRLYERLVKAESELAALRPDEAQP